MAVRIRLMRAGRRNTPFYRIVVQDKESPRDGKFLEVVGFYDPLPNPHKVVVKKDRVSYWLSKGAEPTETVRSLLKREGVLPIKK